MNPRDFALQLFGPLLPVKTILLTAPDVQWLGQSIVAYHDPRRAPQFFAFEVWPGLTEASFQKCEESFQLQVPHLYKEILSQINGGKLGALRLYGVPPSIVEHGLVNRRTRQPLDLSTANRNWRNEFPNCTSLFHVGSIRWTFDDNAGIFIRENGELAAVLHSGETVKVFKNFEALLEYGAASLQAD
jgi:hypothetical protein